MSAPAQSSDLNIVENILLHIKSKLQQHIHRLNSKHDLYQQTFDICSELGMEPLL